jgi:hypothetical protein
LPRWAYAISDPTPYTHLAPGTTGCRGFR